MATVRARKRTAAAAERLINRELSFLDYDARLLDLARDETLPLLERVFFLKVSADMLDEFFMVRVAALTGQAAAGVSRRLPDGRTPQQTLEEARERVLDLYRSQNELWSDQLCPALSEENIVISGVEELEPEERMELDERFEREIFPVLTPLAVGPGQPFPYISALSISLGLFVADPDSGEERCPRACRDSFPSGSAGGSYLSSASSRTTYRSFSPGWRSSSARCSVSRATAISRSRTRPTTCSKPSSSSFAAHGSGR